MTADERIEKLLNHFGETIEDLPKPPLDGIDNAYLLEHRNIAYYVARFWGKQPFYDEVTFLTDYICHLTDIIDRMENALETALICADCEYCENWEEKKRCSRNACCFRIDDIALHDEIEWGDDDEKKTATGTEGQERHPEDQDAGGGYTDAVFTGGCLDGDR